MGIDAKRAVVAEAIGTALLLATVGGSGIMAERLCGGNIALALLAVPPLAGLLHAGPVPALAGASAVMAGVVAPLWLEGVKRLRAG